MYDDEHYLLVGLTGNRTVAVEGARACNTVKRYEKADPYLLFVCHVKPSSKDESTGEIIYNLPAFVCMYPVYAPYHYHV